jgi:signal transduction histidine kinase
VLVAFGIGLGYTLLGPRSAPDRIEARDVALVLSSVVASSALVASWMALLRWRNESDPRANTLALVVPGLVLASEAVAGTRIALNGADHGPTIAQIAIGATATALLLSEIVRPNRTTSRAPFLRFAVCAVVAAALTTAGKLAFRDHPALENTIRRQSATVWIPVTWLIMAVLVARWGAVFAPRLRRALTVMFVALAASGAVLRADTVGSKFAAATTSAGLGAIAMISVLIGLACEAGATRDEQRRRIAILEFERSAALSKLEADRLAASRRSHDQRAALLSVEAVIHLLQSDSNTLDLATRKRLTTAASQELTRLRSGCEDTSPTAERRDVDLLQLLEPVIAVAMADGAHVVSDIRAGLVVHVSERALADVVRNLISNAVQHGENRAITVSSRRTSYEFVELSVSDLGPGVPPARRFDLFEPGRSSGGPERLGLGLNSARTLLREMGGDLTLDRGYTRGARFVAMIPAGVHPTSGSETSTILPGRDPARLAEEPHQVRQTKSLATL